MQLFEELNISDFKIYIDLVQNLFKSTLNLQMQDSDEIILIPLVSLLNEKIIVTSFRPALLITTRLSFSLNFLPFR